MAIQTPGPAVTKVTTVANVSTTERFPVERADNAKVPPTTRPPQQAQDRPRPAAPTPAPVARTTITYPTRQRPAAIVRQAPGVNAGREDRPDGIGPGMIPPGGIKVR